MAKLMATLAKYQIRHGEYPQVWYVDREEMYAITGRGGVKLAVLDPVDGVRIEFRLRALSEIFKMGG